MAIEEMKKRRAYQFGLVVCAIVIVTLGGAFYYTYQGQLTQINSLKQDNDNLQIQITALNSQIDSLRQGKSNLQNQINSLKEDKDALQNQVNDLRKVSLKGTFNSTYIPTRLGIEGHRVTGMIVNYGMETAMDVQVIFRWYTGGALLYTATASPGNISGRSFQSFDITYNFEGSEDSFTYEIKWV